MKAIVAVVFLSVYCKEFCEAYEEYKDIEYDRKDNDDFDDQYYTENMEGALKELLAGRQLDGLTTGTETITSTEKTMIETTHDLRGLTTKDVDFVDRTKFYEELVEEIINNARKQGQGTNTAIYSKPTPTVFETQTDDAIEKTNDRKTTHTIDGEEETETRTKIYNTGNLEHNTNVSIVTFTTQRAPTKTPPMRTWKGGKEISTPPETSERISFSSRNETSFPHRRFHVALLPEAPKRTLSRTSARITIETVYDKKFGKYYKNAPSGFGSEKGEKYRELSADDFDYAEPDQKKDKWSELANELPNMFPADHPVFPRRKAKVKAKKKLGRQGKTTTRPKLRAPTNTEGEVGPDDSPDEELEGPEPDQKKDKWSELANELPNMFPADHPFFPRGKAKVKAKKKLGRQGKATTRPKLRAPTNTEGEAGPDDSPDEELEGPDKYLPRYNSTTTTTRRTTMILADAHLYPYPYPSEQFPNTTATNVTKRWRTRRLKTTRPTPSTKPHVDVPALLKIITRLTKDFESNITEVFNATLQTYDVPTCPPPGYRGVYSFDLYNATIVAKCFVCGLKETAIPNESFCGDAFATDFLPLVPIDPQARQHLVRFRKYCRYLEVHNYYENETQPRAVYGRFTGGCSVRFMDLSNVYTQRACRNKRRAMTGKHFASKRMAKLEMALNEVDNGCIMSPMASLVPMSRGISLYARFHACVCTGSWCNTAVLHQPWISYIAVPVSWTVMTFERWVGHWFWFHTV